MKFDKQIAKVKMLYGEDVKIKKSDKTFAFEKDNVVYGENGNKIIVMPDCDEFLNDWYIVDEFIVNEFEENVGHFVYRIYNQSGKCIEHLEQSNKAKMASVQLYKFTDNKLEEAGSGILFARYGKISKEAKEVGWECSIIVNKDKEIKEIKLESCEKAHILAAIDTGTKCIGILDEAENIGKVMFVGKKQMGIVGKLGAVRINKRVVTNEYRRFKSNIYIENGCIESVAFSENWIICTSRYGLEYTIKINTNGNNIELTDNNTKISINKDCIQIVIEESIWGETNGFDGEVDKKEKERIAEQKMLEDRIKEENKREQEDKSPRQGIDFEIIDGEESIPF